jgi:ppGpp synthetase/RelA/SpoT-type nucleotidyltranferase
MELVDEVVARYRREFDFYEHAARLVAQILDSNLQSAGIRAIVTARAKNPTRFEQKIRQRSATHNYSTVEDIYSDIVDMAGARVALYFPGEREEVGKLVRKLFTLVGPPKQFPSTAAPTYQKRFSGYWATHYRVQIPETALNDAQKRYSEARVEVQVASVLMHAWSEVEHDLVYKPLQGRLSDEEYAILDELNGLVMAGEIALERLQRAGELRVTTRGRQFLNHYDLAAFLLEQARSKFRGADLGDTALGRVDLLFRFVTEADLNTPEKLEPFIAALHADLEKRPISEQIIDQILAQDSTRYSIYETIRGADMGGGEEVSRATLEQSMAIGEFLSRWIEFEQLIRTTGDQTGLKGLRPTFRAIEQSNIIDPEARFVLERLRYFRNNLVHGVEVPDPDTIREAADEMGHILQKMKGVAPRRRRLLKPKGDFLTDHPAQK